MSKSINFLQPLSEKVDLLGARTKNEHAKQMIQLYKANYSGSPFVTFAIKFDQEDLTDFNKLIGETKADGFAVYLAMYPLNGTLNPSGKAYSGRHTIVMIPTISGKPVVNPYEALDPKTVNSDADAYNHGELEP